MKSRIRSIPKTVCKGCYEVQKRDLERAIKEGFKAGVAVCLKTQQLAYGYGKKRLQRFTDEIKQLIELRPFDKEIDFKAVEKELETVYKIDFDKLKITVDIQAGKE